VLPVVFVDDIARALKSVNVLFPVTAALMLKERAIRVRVSDQRAKRTSRPCQTRSGCLYAARTSSAAIFENDDSTTARLTARRRTR
jgi:hypothetical protein